VEVVVARPDATRNLCGEHFFITEEEINFNKALLLTGYRVLDVTYLECAASFRYRGGGWDRSPRRIETAELLDGDLIPSLFESGQRSGWMKVSSPSQHRSPNLNG